MSDILSNIRFGLFGKKSSPLTTYLSRPTERSFPKRVTGVDNLDQPARELLGNHMLPDEQARMIIALPSQAVLSDKHEKKIWFPGALYWEITPAYVLVLTGKRLLFVSMAAKEAQPRVFVVPLDHLLYIRAATILLYSWFELCWVDQGQVQRTRFYFNSVGEGLFLRLSGMIRQAFSGEAWDDSVQKEQMDRNDPVLQNLPLKFQNLIPSRLLIPGEKIKRLVYCSEIQNKRFGLFRVKKNNRMVTIWTESQIIHAGEDQSDAVGQYGLVASFCPLMRFSRIEIKETQAKKHRIEIKIVQELDGVEDGIVQSFPEEKKAELEEFAKMVSNRAM